MKSARERSRQAWTAARMQGGDAAIDALELLFKEHARDQRHLCAEAVNAAAEPYGPGDLAGPAAIADRAHALAMNAPAPGER